MLVRMLIKSVVRRKGRKAVAVAAIWVGLSLVVSLLLLGLDVGDKMNRELSSLGANIVVEPLATSVPVRFGGYDFAPDEPPAYLNEKDLDQLKVFFWRNNILGIVPKLWTRARWNGRELPIEGTWFKHTIPVKDGDPFSTGMRAVYADWLAQGKWPAKSDECVVGNRLAQENGIKPGDRIQLTSDHGDLDLHVTGIVATGEREDGAVIAPLPTVQRAAQLPGRISEAVVTALTTPANRLAQKFHLDPKSLTPEEYERFVCTPYPGSVAANIQQALPGSAARVVRRVAETQGTVLQRIEGLMALLGVLTLVACCLSILGVLASSVLERRSEVALMEAIGASRGQVLLLFLSEAAALGLLGGVLAAATGPLLGQWLLHAVFHGAGSWNVALVILTPLLGVGIAVLANLWPLWRLLHTDVAPLLHGG